MSEQTGEAEKPSIDNDLLDPYERLIEIDVLGKQVEVLRKIACCAASNTSR